MRNMKWLLVVLVALLSGCAHFANGNRVSPPSSGTENNPPLRVPPGMEISYDTLYPIPQRHYANATREVDITPPSLDNSPNAGSGWFSWY